jgi:diguanylate cyclase (GGDEF)-like protein
MWWEATSCAERLRKNVMSLVMTSGKDVIRVTVSIGIAEKTDHMSSLDELLSLSDQHLYAAKQVGRNRTICRK